MADAYKDMLPGISGPAENIEAVTPNDSADLPNTSRALFVNGAGDVALVTVQGQTVTITSANSQYHPIRVARVLATGTTATNILALW